MSLDVYLYAAATEKTHCRCECGHEHEKTERLLLYTANITHNLGPMAAMKAELARLRERDAKVRAVLGNPGIDRQTAINRALELLKETP